jgi:hypothetical protein
MRIRLLLKTSQVHRSLPVYHQPELDLWFFSQLLCNDPATGNKSGRTFIHQNSDIIPVSEIHNVNQYIDEFHEWIRIITPPHFRIKNHYCIQAADIMITGRVRNDRNTEKLSDLLLNQTITLGNAFIRAEMTVKKIVISPDTEARYGANRAEAVTKTERAVA